MIFAQIHHPQRIEKKKSFYDGAGKVYEGWARLEGATLAFQDKEQEVSLVFYTVL